MDEVYEAEEKVRYYEQQMREAEREWNWWKDELRERKQKAEEAKRDQTTVSG